MGSKMPIETTRRVVLGPGFSKNKVGSKLFLLKVIIPKGARNLAIEFGASGLITQKISLPEKKKSKK
jgi:hypothetical protein